MELTWLEDFLELAETGSFSRAAEARNITQPAFSRRIKSLEDWVGAPLFIRTPQRTTLTTAGEQFLRGAPDLVRRLLQLRREAREAGGRETATLRFAATHVLSFTFFPHWIRSVESHGSFGPVRLLSDSMQACEELMFQGQAQFLLCHSHTLAPSRFEPRQFRSAVVGHDALMPLVAPGADGRPRWSLDTPGEVPLLAYTGESGLGRIVAAHRFEERAPGLKPVFSAHLAASLLGMACDGRGVAWLPHSVAAQDMAAGRLIPAGGAEWEIGMDIVLFRPNARQSPAAEGFWAEVNAISA